MFYLHRGFSSDHKTSPFSLMQNAAGRRNTLAGSSALRSELARADAALLQKLCACIIQHCA